MSRKSPDPIPLPPRTGQAVPTIRVAKLTKTYRTAAGEAVTALEDVSLSMAQSEFASVIGPSGCGKTTLLRILAGLIGQYEGEVALRGSIIRGPSRDVGVAFQDSNLLPWRTALDNIMLPVQVLHLDREASLRRARELIALVGLEGFENKLPHELSGGMRQRVSIARALIHDPSILLLDEPFGALDAMTRDAMNVELMRIWARSQKTIFLITHSIAEAVFLSDRVVIMSKRPGRIMADIRIDLARPRGLEVTASPRFGEYLLEIRRILDGGQESGGRAAASAGSS
jgi:NitT/TauT family transport system ATP-binding protein